MNDVNGFMGMFGGAQEEQTVSTSLLSADAPNALETFMGMFNKPMESYWFYNDTVELRFDKESHKYFKVQELGDLKEVKGVTNSVHIIDRSAALVPWSAKKVADKLLSIIPIEIQGTEGTESWIPRMSLSTFTELVMQAKKAPQEEKEEAGDIGHMAHECLEDSINHVLQHTKDHIVRELKNLPDNVAAVNAANSALNWMQAHNVRWIKTESKIYSKEYEYAGTMDGLAMVDSCNNRTCCRNQFSNHLSLIDWKSSNYLYIEFLFQTASYQHAEQEESGIKIVDRWVLRLGKDEDEAGKFEPWYMGPEDFEKDFNGFLTCLRLTNLVEEVKHRMSTQKKEIRTVKKEVKREEKVLAKAVKRAEKAKAKEELQRERDKQKLAVKLEAEKQKVELRQQRAILKEQMKEIARKAREEKRAIVIAAQPSVISGGGGSNINRVDVKPVVEKVEVKLFEIPME